MADYYQVKNQNIFTPPANISLGNTSNQYSNVYVQNNLVVGNVTVTSSTIIAPRVTTITYPGNDTAADPAGGQTITLTGSGFVVSASILINSIAVSVVSVVSSTVITFTSPANSSGSYVIYVVNPNGSTAIAVPGIQYSGIPTWTTAAGTLGSLYETASFTQTVVATGDAPITYSVFSGTLPPGATFNGNGTITGTSQLTASPTTYTFTVSATDAEQQDTNRSFSLTINTDVVTWTTPAANSTTTLGQNAASTTTLLATSAAGKAITYTANALPTGLSISGATVTGTPTVIGNTTSLFTATAATTGRTTTATINWTISVATDLYFRYNSLLLSAGTFTSTFIEDASTNNAALTKFGDTRPNNFNPYTPGYYSNYIPTTSDYYSYSDTLSGNFGTGDFTVEGWFYLSASAHNIMNPSTGTSSWGFLTYGSQFYWQENGGNYGGTGYGTVPINQWVHLAVSRTGGYLNLYINGVRVLNSANTFNYSGTPTRYIGPSGSTSGLYWISNIRFIKGTGIYSGATVTVPTSPLTAIANTSLLTCQSNRMIDNSTNAVVFTQAGSPQIQSFTPFVPNTTYATYGSTYFDGTGDYLTTPASGAFIMGTNDFTFECWVKPTVITSGNNNILAQWGSGNAFIFRYVAAGRLRFDGAGSSVTGTTTAVTVNQWNHVAITRSSSTVRLFVNGVLDATTGTIGALSEGASVVAIAAYVDGSGEFVTGYISNLRLLNGTALYTTTFTPPTTPLTAITNTVLLTCQTNQPVNNSVFLDNSTNAFAVTRVGNTSAGTFSPYGSNWSMYQSSVDSVYLGFTTSVGTSFQFTGDFTIEGYVYYSSSSGDGSLYVISDGSNYLALNISMSAGNYNIYLNSGAATSSFSHGISVGVWTHVAMVRSGSTVTLYTNGVSRGTLTNSSTLGYSTPSINRTGGGVAGIDRYISNVRVVKGTAVYTAAFTPSTTPLTAIANTVLLTCQSNRFVDNSTNAFAVTITGNVAVQRFSPFSPQTQTAITHSVYYGTKTDYISIPATTALTTFTGDFTFECWVNPTDTSISTNWGIWDSRQNGQTASAMIFTLQNLASPVTGQWRLGYYYGSGTQTYGTGIVLANQWTHVAFVRSGSTLTYYVNGVAGGTATVSGTQTGSATSNPVYIGSKDGSLSGYGNVGYISNFRIVKGVAVYTGNFSVPTAPLTATQAAGTNIAAVTGTQTSLLTCQSPTFIDNSTNAFTITAVGETNPRTYNPFGFTNALAAYSAAVYGGSAYFNGSTDYISVPDNVAFTMGAGDFTLECWVYLSNVAQQIFIGTCNAAASQGSMSFVLGLNGSSYPQVGVGYAGAMYFSTFGTVLTTNRWYHIAGVRNGAMVNVYVDGVKGPNLNMASLAITDSTETVAIGRNGAGNFEYVTGYIANVRIVKGTAVYTANFVPPTASLTAITNTSLLLNMTSAGVYDSTMINDLETVGDAKSLSTQTPYAGSYYSNYFDGSGDYLTVPDNAAFTLSTNDFTFECWVNPTVITSGNNNILAQWGSGNAFIFRYVAAGRLKFDGAGSSVTGTTTAVTAGQWNHIAITRSSSTVRLFVNGVVDATTGTIGALTDGTSVVSIGAYTSGSSEWVTGYISNLRLLNGTALYTTTFTPPTTPLTAIANTVLLTCQSTRFLDNSTNAFTITRAGDTSVQAFNPFQRNSATTLYFDGTGDGGNVSSLAGPLTGNFTYEAWVYPTSSALSYRVIFGLDSYATASTPFRLYQYGTNFQFWYTSTAGNFINSSTITIAGWYHIAITRSGTDIRMFVNGIQAGTTLTSAVNYPSSAFRVGMDSAGTYPFIGYISDLRVTNGIARYTTTFTPPTIAFSII